MKVAACLFRTVTFLVNRCAIGHPLGLPTDDMQSRLPKW
jgi:hypothetical protein